MGNYWSDYKVTDADEDGIGDTPYSIDSDKDRYPLMGPWENYFIENLPPVDDFTYTPEKTLVNETQMFNVSNSCGSYQNRGQSYPKKRGGLSHEPN